LISFGSSNELRDTPAEEEGARLEVDSISPSVLAANLKVLGPVLENFLVEIYGKPPPTRLARRVVPVVEKSFRDWLAHPKLISMSRAAESVGVDSVVYVEFARAFLTWPVNTLNSKIQLSEAERFHQWLLDCGVIERLPTEWPPILDFGEMRTLAVVDGLLDVRLSDVPTSTSDPEDVTGLGRPSEDEFVESGIKRLIEESKIDSSRKMHFFLLRLMERVNADGEMMEVIRRAGIPVRILEDVVNSFGRRVPSPKAFSDFLNDLKWAVIRLRRNAVTEIWISENIESGPRLTVKPLTAKSSKSSLNPTAKSEIHVGQIRWIKMEETRRGKKSLLAHPAVIVGVASRNKWLVISLTSTVEGAPDHRRVPRPTEQGLEKAGYVWHEVQKVYVNQIGPFIGWCHPDLVEVVSKTVRVRLALLDELRRVAEAKHVV